MDVSLPDLSPLAQQLAHFLQPFLPYLLGMGEKVAEEMGKKIGGEAWEQAKALWGKLGRKDKVKAAAEAAMALPDNSAIQQGLVEEILRALKEDPALAQALAEAMKDEVVQRVIATGGSQIKDVNQEAQGGPTRQEVRAEEQSTIKGVRQIRR